MFKFEKIIRALAEKFNWIAAGAIVFMMVLTSLDVFLRIFRTSIPGTYEFIGLFGSVVISFSLAFTTINRGHIAVEFLVQKLSQKKQFMFGFATEFLSMILFAVVSWRSFVYAMELVKSGEVSLTTGIPTYPFVLGVALGCGLQSLFLFTDSVKSFKGAMK